MTIARWFLLSALMTLLAACAQQSSSPTVPERGSADYLKVRDSIADEVYVEPFRRAGAPRWRCDPV